ncbi:MAG: phosphate acyltransferase PlsX [Abditibacteriota bacterium]|nr:phosphate acyltransferase PlsX [Abditibacteriota bacterium]
MKIAVDAMGGDFAPREIVRGVCRATELYDVDAILVGQEEAIRACIPARFADSPRISVVNATEVIRMDDHVDAIRTKKDASLVRCAELVRSGEADAMVGVGNTAATMSVATLKIGRVPGIHRPAISSVFPGIDGPSIVLDLGAVADCTPRNLVEFAYMGSIYAQKVLKLRSPKVALLSIGEEESKGNEVTKATHQLLKKSSLNFIGNIEGRQICDNYADVIVTDGFTGNVTLKVAEGMGAFFKTILKNAIKKNILCGIPFIMMAPVLSYIKKKLDYTEYGGAPLLGINGVCIIGHGRSNAKAVCNAVKAAKTAAESRLVQSISECAAEVKETLSAQ